MTSWPDPRSRLVVVGSSWGGLEAVAAVLAAIPHDADFTMAVAQHRAGGPSSLAEVWSRYTTWPVVEPDDKQPIVARHVFVAPPGYHLMVEGPHLALSTDAPHNYSRPAIDVLFESAARTWGHRVVALVLSGSNADGAAGAAEVMARGGRVVVQDPAGASHPQMPSAALAAAPGAAVLPLAEIGGHLARLLGSITSEAGSAS